MIILRTNTRTHARMASCIRARLYIAHFVASHLKMGPHAHAQRTHRNRRSRIVRARDFIAHAGCRVRACCTARAPGGMCVGSLAAHPNAIIKIIMHARTGEHTHTRARTHTRAVPAVVIKRRILCAHAFQCADVWTNLDIFIRIFRLVCARACVD